MRTKSLLIFLSLVLACHASPAHAQADDLVDVYYLVLTQQNGSVSKFALSGSPVMTYSGNDVIITCGGQHLQTSMKGIANCSFTTEKSSSGIEPVRSHDRRPTFALGTASFDGMMPGNRITVYTLDGKTLKTATADAEGRACINLNSLPHGIYILRTAERSYTISK